MLKATIIVCITLCLSLNSVQAYFVCANRIGTMECSPIMVENFDEACYRQLPANKCLYTRNSYPNEVCNYRETNTRCQNDCSHKPTCYRAAIGNNQVILIKIKDRCGYVRIKQRLENQLNVPESPRTLIKVKMSLCNGLEYNVPALHPCRTASARTVAGSADNQKRICAKIPGTSDRYSFRSLQAMHLYNCIEGTNYVKVSDCS